MKSKTVKYRGFDLSIMDATICEKQPWTLLRLRHAPEVYKQFARVTPCTTGVFPRCLDLSIREVQCIIEIEGVYYLPHSDGEFCSIEVLIAKRTKLGGCFGL